MLDRGRVELHQSVLWITHEYLLKLEECGQTSVTLNSQKIINIVAKHLEVLKE